MSDKREIETMNAVASLCDAMRRVLLVLPDDDDLITEAKTKLAQADKHVIRAAEDVGV